MVAKKKAPESFDVLTAEIRAQLPYAREDYEPVFDREGPTHRVLSFITDEIDGPAGNRPRNTLEAIAMVMVSDPASPGVEGPTLADAVEQVGDAVDELVDAGFVERRDDGTLALTDDGMVELTN